MVYNKFLSIQAQPIIPYSLVNMIFTLLTIWFSSIFTNRFDFINVQLTDPTPATGACTDALTVATPARNQAAGFVPGALCGVLTGQHSNNLLSILLSTIHLWYF